MSNGSKRYSDDFKKMIVNLYNSGISVWELHYDYNLAQNTIYRWIQDFSPPNEADTPTDIDTLRKENLRLKQELKILKKAIEILTRGWV